MKEANIIFAFTRSEFPDSRNIVEDYYDADTMLDVIAKSPADIYILSTIGDRGKAHLKLALEIRARYKGRSILFVIDDFEDLANIINTSLAPDYVFKSEVTAQEFKRFISLQNEKNPTNKMLSFNEYNKKQIINMQAVISAQAINKKVALSTTSRTFITILTIAELEKSLPENFVRIDKGIIINSDHIRIYDSETEMITLMDGKEFPVSRRGKKRLLKSY